MSAGSAVGFLGLGNMGAPMAARLLRHGYALRLFDLRLEAAAAVAAGKDAAEVGASPRAVAEGCDLAVTMLPDSEAVRAAVTGPHGLAEGLRPGALIVDMSSCAPTATRALGETLAGRGIALVDAPVSGGVPRAEDGSLTIMAGGPEAALARAEPVLGCLGRVIRTGPLGSGHAMKALNNYVSAAGLLAVCEALIVAERFGLDPRVMNDVLKASTGRNNTTDKKVEQQMLNRAFASGFALDLLCKDVGIAGALAAALGLEAPGLQHTRATLERAAEALVAGADHTAAYLYLEQRLGGET